jgi:hypothetical protein
MMWSYRLLARVTDWIVPSGYSQDTVLATPTADQLAQYFDLIADQKDATMADWYRRKGMLQLGKGDYTMSVHAYDPDQCVRGDGAPLSWIPIFCIIYRIENTSTTVDDGRE